MQHRRTDTITLRSAIKPELMSSVLFKGTVLASFGAGSLLYAGVYLPKETLVVWGTPLFIFSFALIYFGLLPYKRVAYLEKKPHQIELSDQTLVYARYGKPAFTVPVGSAKKITYIDRGSDYGIGILLKKSPSKKVLVHDKSINIDKYQATSQKKYGCDLFLPYFSERSFNRIIK